MPNLLTAAQMRGIEQAAIDSGSVTGLDLMERAGNGVVEAIFEEWPELAVSPRKALVLCGPGNNGSDGYVIARLLKNRGWTVFVFQMGAVQDTAPDALVNRDRWSQLGCIRDLEHLPVDTYAQDNPGTVLVIDAIFGTGLTRPFDTHGDVQDILNYWRSAWTEEGVPRVVSVDLPSGLCADSGRFLSARSDENPLDHRLLANLTVTFHDLKLGHMLGVGPTACGKVRVKSIGLDRPHTAPTRQAPSRVTCGLHENTVARLIGKSPSGQKYSHGHALILGGGPGQGGAARLAARGALRIGAGLVTIACPASALQENAARLDAIMLKSMRDLPESDALAGILGDARINAVCLGPGLGLDRAQALVSTVLDPGATAPRATVLDADALSAFADDPSALFDKLHDGCILTPHGGEFARLFPDLAERLHGAPVSGPAYSKVDATKDAAARAGCVVLFKGSDTVIAGPDGQAIVSAAQYARAAPWLATAGSGDVLAGFVTGLLARGIRPIEAADIAARLHVDCARAFGAGLVAEDIPEMLPKVFARLGI